MTPAQLDAALATARAAVLASPDPLAAAEHLLRWARQECTFAVSAAALPKEDLIAARAGGHRLQEFAATVRR